MSTLATQTATSAALPFAPVICYHTVLPATESSFVYNVVPEVFAAHMRLLAPGGASAPMEVTFDDGHASAHRHALPALAASGVRAKLFITVGWTGARPGYLDWDELAEIARQGHAIAAHGWSHALLTHCDDGQLAAELARPKQALEDRLGSEVSEISMPGGRYDLRVLRACAAAGYRRAYTSDAFTATAAGPDGLELRGRIMARRETSAEVLSRLLAGDAAPLRALEGRQRIGRALKRILGDRAYHALWRRWARAESAEPMSGVPTEPAPAEPPGR